MVAVTVVGKGVARVTEGEVGVAVAPDVGVLFAGPQGGRIELPLPIPEHPAARRSATVMHMREIERVDHFIIL
jgi:hypothetical protein